MVFGRLWNRKVSVSGITKILGDVVELSMECIDQIVRHIGLGAICQPEPIRLIYSI